MEQDVPVIDLESYVANYSGHARINRLLFIAEKSHGQQQADALVLAHGEVMQTQNLAAYHVIIERIGGRLGEDLTLDKQWVSQVERACQERQDKLEAELASAKANLIKESIHRGHFDLGDYYYSRGDLKNAGKCYVRVRDYCTSPRHLISMYLALIRVNVEAANFWNVGDCVAKAENTADCQSDPVVVAQLTAASGLSLLQNKRYKQAARKFLEVTGDLAATFNDVLAMQDVALYAALCALATFDRNELGERLIKNVDFKELLDTVPEVRDIVQAFYGCRYAAALSALTALAPTFALDIYLDTHLPPLLQQIRQRALIQYTSPFTSLRLATMAQAFNSTEADLGKELSQLIMDGHIRARIDAHAGVLHARRTDARVTTFAKALALSQNYVTETKAALLRVDLIAHDFLQKPRSGVRGGDGARGMDFHSELRGLGGLGRRASSFAHSGAGMGFGIGGAMMGDEDDEATLFMRMIGPTPGGREGRSSGRRL